MPDIDEEKIKRLDGSLLLVLRELLRLQRTTLVARRLGLSQSAVSHALARLRGLFGDPLFTRKAHGVEPTRRALELGPRVEALLSAMGEALGEQDGFSPETTDRAFRLAAPDHLATLLAPRLVQALRARAPAARFAFSQRLGQDAIDAVSAGEIDLALGRFAARAPGLSFEPLFSDRYCLVARARHPRLRGRLTRARYARLDHVQISVAGDFRSLEIEPFGQAVVPRRAVAAVPRFLMAFAVAARTDTVAVAPRRLALEYAASFGLRVHELPFALAPIRVVAVRRAQSDRAVAWLLEVIAELVAS
jgi:DNA-binding transcriptional LysR family regulator